MTDELVTASKTDSRQQSSPEEREMLKNAANKLWNPVRCWGNDDLTPYGLFTVANEQSIRCVTKTIRLIKPSKDEEKEQ